MKWILHATIALAMVGTMTAGTGFMGASGGKKTFKLNDKISKNKIEFVSEAPAEKINGTADGLWGSFMLNPSDLEATSGSIKVKVRSMKTAISKRDEHMYSPMWLDADAHPEVTFTVKSLSNIETSMVNGRHVATATAAGTFTIHGVTKPMTARVNITYLPESAETKKRASGDLAMVTATFEVSLADYNIKGKSGVIGKSVGKTIQIQASLFANS